MSDRHTAARAAWRRIEREFTYHLGQLAAPIVALHLQSRYLAGANDPTPYDAPIPGKDGPSLTLRDLNQVAILDRIDEQRIVAQRTQPPSQPPHVIVDDELHGVSERRYTSPCTPKFA